MKHTRAAQRYAKAIVGIAQKEDILDTVIEDFRTLRHAIENSRDLHIFLATPVINDPTKEKVLTEIFSGKVSETTNRFLALLARKGRASSLSDVAVAFQQLIDRQQNIVSATITTAVELNVEQRTMLEEHLSQMSGHSVRAQYRVDPDVIGGFSARIGDKMVDATIRHQLDRLLITLVQGAGSWQATMA